MKKLLIQACSLVIALSLTASGHDATPNQGGKFEAGKNTFLLNGEPYVIKAAELHYPRIPRPYWDNRIKMCKADCLALPFEGSSFDCVTVAYGVRNFENLAKGYREMARVLRPGGMLCVIELSMPQGRLVNPLYRFYSGTVIPAVGRLVSSDTSAYSYPPASIAAMPQGRRMLEIMEEAGLEKASLLPLTFGTCAIYTAFKP